MNNVSFYKRLKDGSVERVVVRCARATQDREGQQRSPRPTVPDATLHMQRKGYTRKRPI